MKKWIVLVSLTFPLVVAGCSEHSHHLGAPPPQVVNDVRDRAYHDGFEAARRDVAQSRRPDMRHHENFRHPPVRRAAFEDYRQAFRSGYDAFLHNGRRDDSRMDGPPPYR